MDFRLEVEHRGCAMVVKVFGEVDVFSAPQLEACLDELINAGNTKIHVDLENAWYFDSEGLKVLIKAMKSLGEHGSLAICRANPRVLRVLQISGLDHVFLVS